MVREGGGKGWIMVLPAAALPNRHKYLVSTQVWTGVYCRQGLPHSPPCWSVQQASYPRWGLEKLFPLPLQSSLLLTGYA